MADPGWGGVGLPLAVAALAGCEAGLPVPVPADVPMLALGAAVGAGRLPWWGAVLILELVAVAGTAALLLAAGGPAAGVLTRFGRYVGLTPARIARGAGIVERGGPVGLATARATPGLRTVTVLAAGAAGLPTRKALPALVAGSTLFLQGHLVLGLAVGAPLRAAWTTGPGRIAVAAIVAVLAAVALLLRRRKVPANAWAEGICPVCLAVSGLVPDPRPTKEPMKEPTTGRCGPDAGQS